MRMFQWLPSLVLLAPTMAVAQVPETQQAPTPAATPLVEDRGARWRTSYFPYLTGGANDSPVLAARFRHWQPADYEARSTYTAAFNADAGIAPKGSRFVSVQFKAPGLVDGWRLAVQGAMERQVRYGYFGIGNNTVYDKDLIGDDDPFLYRMRRTRYRVSAEVTRRIRGPLHVAVLTEYEHARFTSLPGPSVFATDFPSGELKEDDVTGRLALVYDTRDNEYNTHQGLLLEAGTQVGSGSDGYTRQYVILRGYLPVREGTVVAARIAGSGMGGTPPLDARFTLPGWEHPVPVLGGEYSHRGLDYGRLTGRGDAVRKPRGPPRPAALRRSRGDHAAGLPGRGTGVRGRGLSADHGRHEGGRRRRRRAPDPAVQHLRLQLRRRPRRVQSQRGERVDVLRGRRRRRGRRGRRREQRLPAGLSLSVLSVFSVLSVLSMPPPAVRRSPAPHAASSPRGRGRTTGAPADTARSSGS